MIEWQKNIREFWSKKTILNKLLLPLSYIYYTCHLINYLVLNKPTKVEPFVICVGNLVVGGSGKTPFAIALAKKLINKGFKIAFINSGYGSKVAPKTPIVVDIFKHDASSVGDEALLLAKFAPTYVSKNRLKAAKLAELDNVEIIVMDDGLQNNQLCKNYSFLIIDSIYGLGNKYMLPAGPLREKLKDGYSKADSVVLIKQNQNRYHNIKYDFSACIELIDKPALNKKYFAFCSIANPSKFFSTLYGNGYNIVGTKIFNDHHLYSQNDLNNLRQLAKDATLLTTDKDFVKLPPSFKSSVLSIELKFTLPDNLVDKILIHKNHSQT